MMGSTCDIAPAFEVAEEVSEDLVAGLPAFEELRVHGNIVDSRHVAESDGTVALLVKHAESLLDHALSSLCQLISQATEEFFVSDVPVAVDIVKLHQSLELDLLREESKGRQSLFELTNVKLFVSIEVHTLEDGA